MNDWFEWNGVRCTTLGIHVLEQPPITLASERVTFTDVLGRSGALTFLEGTDVYDDVTLTANCYIADPARIPEIAANLRGEGTVTFANRPGGYYCARIINQISFEKILRGNSQCTFSVNFRCKPFWYKAEVEDLTFTAASNPLTNPGTVHSQPKITIHGSGDFALTVSGQIMRLTDIRRGHRPRHGAAGSSMAPAKYLTFILSLMSVISITVPAYAVTFDITPFEESGKYSITFDDIP